MMMRTPTALPLCDGVVEHVTSSPLTPRFAIGTQDLTPSCDVALDTVRSEDVACIVHDLKSPLATIAIALSVLESQIPNEISRRALNAIRSSVGYMDRLVHDVLDCTHEGIEVLDREVVELGSLLTDVVARLDLQPERARIILEVRDRASVRVDVTRIERVVMNLVSNALAYSPATSRVVVRLEQRDGRACVSVIDRGQGLHPDDVRTIFDRYRRGRAGARIEGSGLGLFASRKLVELHAGRIGVESVEGCGARFYFELPVDRRT